MVNSGERNGAWIPSSPSALGTLGVTNFHPGPLPSQCFPREWRVPQLLPPLRSQEGEDGEIAGKWSGLGGALLCRLWVGVTHIHCLSGSFPTSK